MFIVHVNPIFATRTFKIQYVLPASLSTCKLLQQRISMYAKIRSFLLNDRIPIFYIVMSLVVDSHTLIEYRNASEASEINIDRVVKY